MCTSVCLELVAHFEPISEVSTFRLQSLNTRRPNRWIARERASQECHSIRNILRFSKLSWKYFPSYIIVIFLIIVIEHHINK